MNSDHHDKHRYASLKYSNIVLATLAIVIANLLMFYAGYSDKVYVFIPSALYNSWVVFNIAFHCVSHHNQIKLLKWRGLFVYFLFAIFGSVLIIAFISMILLI